MNKNLTLGLCALLAACVAPVAVVPPAAPAATLAPLPTYTPYPTYTPASVATVAPSSLSVTPTATLVLSTTAKRIQVQDLDGPDVPGGVFRFFDPAAQVVCYVYRDAESSGGIAGLPFQTVAYSGMSCLPVNQTSLGK